MQKRLHMKKTTDMSRRIYTYGNYAWKVLYGGDYTERTTYEKG